MEGSREGESRNSLTLDPLVREKCTLATYNSNDSEKDDHSKCKEGNEGIGLDIGVSVLIHLYQNYTTSDEHKGSVCVSEKNCNRRIILV